MSAAFPPMSNVDKPLVIQFTVKHEQNIDCGGGYIKLFDCKLDQADMHGESPYNIMFGPDICGPGTKKVHVIFEHKGKNHLIKKMKDAQDEEERAKAEAEAGEKGDDEDDEDLDDLDEDEEDEVKDGDDEDAEGHDEL